MASEFVSSTGYIAVVENGKVRHKHRIVAENAYGKKLPSDCTVHHIDGDKKNNNNNNLLICSWEYHLVIEKRFDALSACGNPNYKKCHACKKYGDPEEMVFKGKTGRRGERFYHKHCFGGIR